MSEKNLWKLNKEQQKAVDCINGNLLILASAGTGKTTTIVERFANLVNNHGYKPSEILMTTFTNRAAKDMVRKIVKRTGIEPPYVGTLHSIFLRILRQNTGHVGIGSNFTIIEDGDKKKIVREIVKKEGINPKMDNLKYFLGWIGKFKNRGILAESLSEEHSLDDIKEQGIIEEAMDDEIIRIDPKLRQNVNRIYKKYEQELRKQNLLDFDDILIFAKKLFETTPSVREYYSNKFKAIMIDEAQDLNVVQIDLIGLLAKENLCIIGDDCQNIYEWRGSSPELVFSFNENQKKITLTDNYRSGRNIISSVNDIIKSMTFKIDKKLCCTKDSTGEIKITDFFSFEEELKYIVREITSLLDSGVLKEEVAVLFRTNSIGKDVERILKKNRIPCHLSKSVNFFEREEIRDILSFLRLKLNPYSFYDFARIFVLIKGFGKVTARNIKEVAVSQSCSLIEALQIPPNKKLNIHKVNEIKRFIELVNEVDKDPLDQFLHNFNYINILKNKYAEEIDKFDEKMENINTLKELFNGRAYSRKDIQDFLDELMEIDKKEKTKSRITLSTIHGAKGLEWKHVFLISCNEGILPFYKGELAANKRESELKLFYVAVSRAIDSLRISTSTTRQGSFYEKSTFLDIIEKHAEIESSIGAMKK